MNRIEIAKSIVKSVYPSCKYSDIRSSCHRWGESQYVGFSIHAGMFRSVIIPDDCDFVIKVGACRGGAEQCRREVDRYAKAVERGVSDYFAEMFGSFRYHNHEFYVMERVEQNQESSTSFYRLCVKNNEQLGDFIDDFGINDIHSANFGFDSLGNPKVFDYGGYDFGDNDEEVERNWTEY